MDILTWKVIRYFTFHSLRYLDLLVYYLFNILFRCLYLTEKEINVLCEIFWINNQNCVLTIMSRDKILNGSKIWKNRRIIIFSGSQFFERNLAKAFP